VEGAHRFLKRLWNLAARLAAAGEPGTPDDSVREARLELHRQLQKALFDYERQQFNTVVSACMSMVNVLNKLDDTPAGNAVLREGIGIVLRLLAPIAPHITHHLWRELGYGEDILSAGWPQVDEEALACDTIELVVQVNGKVRGRVQVPAEADRERIEAAAQANENVARFIEGKTVRKIIVVPGKLVNIVAN
jgi:leucyl-tRNA synthetase